MIINVKFFIYLFIFAKTAIPQIRNLSIWFSPSSNREREREKDEEKVYNVTFDRKLPAAGLFLYDCNLKLRYHDEEKRRKRTRERTSFFALEFLRVVIQIFRTSSSSRVEKSRLLTNSSVQKTVRKKQELARFFISTFLGGVLNDSTHSLIFTHSE